MASRLPPSVPRAALDDLCCASATSGAAPRSAVGAAGAGRSAGGRAALVALGVAGLLLSGACSHADPDGPDLATPDLATPDPGKPDLATPLGPDEIPLKVDKRCPGGPDCADTGDDVLYAGVAVVNATPEVEKFTDTNANGLWDDGEPYDDVNKNGKFDAYWMAGYGTGRLAYGVNPGDGVWARALALRQNKTTVVLVAVDSLGLFADETTEVEKLLDKGLGIDLLMIHATHVHESADLVGGWGPDNFTNGVNSYYQDQMRHHIARAVTQALAGLVPARVTMSSIAVQDTDRDMKRYVSDVRDPVVIENTLHTLQFTDITDEKKPKVITTLVNWAHHPESEGSKNHLISSDWVHFMRAELESKGAGPVVYVSGALGGQIGPGRVEPVDDMGNVIKGSGFPKAEAIGKSVSRFALTAMADPQAVTVQGKAARLAFRSSMFPARVDNLVYHLAAQVGIYKRSLCCYDTGKPVSEENTPSILTKTAYLTLGPASIITNPGELLPELFIGGYGGEYAGLYQFIDLTKPNAPDPQKAPRPPYLKDIMDGERAHRMTFGLTFDFVGYIVPPYNWVLSDKSPYFMEAEGDHYEETNSIGPLAAPQIVGTMRQLILDGRPNVAR